MKYWQNKPKNIYHDERIVNVIEVRQFFFQHILLCPHFLSTRITDLSLVCLFFAFISLRSIVVDREDGSQQSYHSDSVHPHRAL